MKLSFYQTLLETAQRPFSILGRIVVVETSVRVANTMTCYSFSILGRIVVVETAVAVDVAFWEKSFSILGRIVVVETKYCQW